MNLRSGGSGRRRCVILAAEEASDLLSRENNTQTCFHSLCFRGLRLCACTRPTVMMSSTLAPVFDTPTWYIHGTLVSALCRKWGAILDAVLFYQGQKMFTSFVIYCY